MMKRLIFVTGLLICFCLAGQSLAGEINVALEGTATKTDPNVYPQYPASFAIDDNFNSFCSTGADVNEWVEIDLIDPCDLLRVVIYNSGDGTFVNDANVMILDASRTLIGEIYNCLAPDGGEIWTLDNDGNGYPNARYIRVEHDSWIKLYEVQAWATCSICPLTVDAGDDATIRLPETHQLDANITDAVGPFSIEWSKYLGPLDGINIALDGTATASSNYGGNFPASLAIDDDFDTFASTNEGAGEWLEVDLGAKYDLQYIVIYNAGDAYYMDGATVEVETGPPAAPVGATVTLSPAVGGDVWVLDDGGNGYPQARYITIYNAGSIGNWIKVDEVQAWTASSVTPVTFDPNAYVLDPIASFGTTPGDYILNLDANDGRGTLSDQVAIEVVQPLGAVVEDYMGAVATSPAQAQFDIDFFGSPNEIEWLYIDHYYTENLALSGTATSSSANTKAGYPTPGTPASVIDGDYATGLSTGSSSGEWINVDLGSEMPLSTVVYYCDPEWASDVAGSSLSVIDGNAGTVASTTITDAGTTVFTNSGAGFASARHIKVEQGAGTKYIVAYEIEAWDYPAVTFDPNEFVEGPLVAFSDDGLFTFQVDVNDGNYTDSDILKVKSLPAGYNQGRIVSVTASSTQAGWGSGDAVLTDDPNQYILTDDEEYTSPDGLYVRSSNLDASNWLASGVVSPAKNVALDGDANMFPHTTYPDNPASLVIDNDLDTYCITDLYVPAWLEIELADACDLEKVVIYNDDNPGCDANGTEIKILDPNRDQIGATYHCYAPVCYEQDIWTLDNDGNGYPNAKFIRAEVDGIADMNYQMYGDYIAFHEVQAWTAAVGVIPTADQYLEFELAGKYLVNYIRLWNFNASSTDNEEGIKDFNIWVKENSGDSYTQIGGTLTAMKHPTTFDEGDKSEVFALDTSAFTDGVQFVKLDIQSNQREVTPDEVGLGLVAISGDCATGEFVSDIDEDCDVDFFDYAELAARFNEVDCGACGGAELTGEGDVDLADVKKMASEWLQ